MYNILNSDEYTEVEGRKYLNPQVALDESNRFINNLRSNQAQQNQQIATDTYNLGTNIPSAQGGLGTNTPSNMGYFTSRYQTPQTASAVANLRATAQATALSQALQNEQEIWKKRYNDAYRNYQKRMNDKANTPTTPDYGDLLKKLGYDVNEEDSDNTTDIFEEKPGQVIPMSETANKYQDPKTGEWYMLTTPTTMEGYQIVNSGAGQFPVDGKTVTIDGKVFRYDAGTDMWYRQTYMFGQR